MQKRILAWLLVLCMAFSILPITAFAAEPTAEEVKNVTKVCNMIQDLPEVVTAENEKTIEAAVAAYEALNPTEKKYFETNFPETLKKLDLVKAELFKFQHPVTIEQVIPTEEVAGTPDTLTFKVKNNSEEKFIGILNVDVTTTVEDGMTLDFAPYTYKLRDDKSGYQINVEVEAGKEIVVEAKADFIKAGTYDIKSWIKTDKIDEVAGPDTLIVRTYDVTIGVSHFAGAFEIRDPKEQVNHYIDVTNNGDEPFQGLVQIRIANDDKNDGKFADRKLVMGKYWVDADGEHFDEYKKAYDDDGKFIGYDIQIDLAADKVTRPVSYMKYDVENDSYGTYDFEISLKDYKLPPTAPVKCSITELNYDLVITQDIPENIEYKEESEFKFNIENKGNLEYKDGFQIRFLDTNLDRKLTLSDFNGALAAVEFEDMVTKNLLGYNFNVNVGAGTDATVTAKAVPTAFHEFKIQTKDLTEEAATEVSTVRVTNAAMEYVVGLVDAIDAPVTEYSEQQILDAENAYHSELKDPDLKKCFEDYYGVNYLKKLKKAKADLVKAQDAAVENVETLINEIGYVTLEREDAIKAAREAYDALPTGPVTNLKERVSNYKILLDAEQQLAFLKEAEKLVKEAEAARDEAVAAKEAAEAAAKEAGKSAEAAKAAQEAAEAAQSKAEAAQTAAEAAQAKAEEAEGKAAESAKQAAADAKKAAEEAAKAATEAKNAADSAKAAHDAQVAAEAAKAAAEAAKADAEAAAKAAGEDKTKAEAAQKAAEAARDAAVAAQEAAEKAQKAAEDANAEVAAAAAQVAADKAAVAQMKAEVAADLKKAEEAAANSLESAKISLINAIDSYDLSGMTDGHKEMADEVIKAAKAAVETAKTNEEVKAIRDQFLADMEYVKNYKIAYEKYTDVTDTKEWFYEGVEFMLNKGCMLGMTETEFAPHSDLTRAQLVTILYRAAGEPKVEGKTKFTDVPADTWYTNAVIWAADKGVVNGVGDNKFAPEDNITREQLATMLYRYAGSPEDVKGDLSVFPDNGEVHDYAVPALKWTVGKGIVNGCEGKLMPLANASRAHVAVMVARYLGGLKK